MKESSPKMNLSDIQVGSRARILGTIVNRYVTGDKNYGFLVIDDTTDTIRVKVFNNADILYKMNVGNLVDVFGSVEEYEGEVYIKPDMIKKIHDPNWYLVRRLELMRSSEAKPDYDKQNEIAEEKVLNTLKNSSKTGLEFEQILNELKFSKEELQATLSRLMIKGMVYEPSSSKFVITDDEEIGEEK